MTKTLVSAALLCAVASWGMSAQRTISSFKEFSIKSGVSTLIGGEKRSEPDIYYLPKNDGSYQAVRLTVTPPDEPSDMTVPYLNMNTSTAICVNWKTSRQPENAVVRVGLSPDNLDRTFKAGTRMIAEGYYWNTASVDGLTPNTAYYYKVDNDGTESDTYRFRTAPEPGDKSKLRVLFIGDHQRNDHSDYEWMLNAAHQTVKEKYGDGPFEDYITFLMNDGDQVDGGYIDLYEKVHLFKSRSISPTLANMTAVGNHEYSNDPDIKLYKGHYKEYGDLAYKGIKSGDAGYYAYQVGSVLFVVLNSDNPSAVQKMWVRKVIAAASTDSTVDFIVSVQHRPLYAEQWSSDVSAWMMNEIMPILSSTPKHVLNCAGHHHLYARGQMTDTPVYHIISGGGVGTSHSAYEQLWGKTPECVNHDEVQCTIDQWTYQILEFDPQTKEMKVDCYAIGNSRLAVDNELVDSFSRRIGTDEVDDTPVLGAVEETVALPFTFTQTAAMEQPYASQYQVSATPDFNETVIDKVVTCQDFYGVTEDFRPLDLNAGKNLKEFTVEDGSLLDGTYYVRVRNRNSNLEWSDFSEPVKFTVEGASAPMSIAMEHKFYHPGTVKVSYTGAPVGTKAWIGIYKEHHKPGSSDLSYRFAYTNGADGSCDFTINDHGAFFAVLFEDEGYTEASERCYFVVSDNCDDATLPSMSLGKQAYGNDEPVVVKLSNAPCIAKDWIGVYTADVAALTSTHSIHYSYVGADPNGEVTLNVKDNINYKGVLDDGFYFLAYCIADNYYEPAERAYFIIGKPVQLEALAPEVKLGEPAGLLFEGVPTWVEGAQVCVFDDKALCSSVPVRNSGDVVEVPVDGEGNYTACVATADGTEISPRVGFSVVDPKGSSSLDLTGENASEALHVTANGEIAAAGDISVYTPAGVLCASGNGRVSISTPGIYIVRASGVTARVVVR